MNGMKTPLLGIDKMTTPLTTYLAEVKERLTGPRFIASAPADLKLLVEMLERAVEALEKITSCTLSRGIGYDDMFDYCQASAEGSLEEIQSMAAKP